jgi:hypothetical protein
MNVQAHELFYPMLAMFVWAFLILFTERAGRVVAVLKGELTNEYFELFRGAEPSDLILKTQNHLRNLMELPPLFDIVALVIMFTGKTDSTFLMSAWSYVVLRVGHGLVHLTISKVPVRFFLFILSSLALLVMWVRLAALL